MDIARSDDPAAFADLTGAFLAADEAMNNLPLGILARLREPPSATPGDPPVLLAAVDAGTVVGVALMTPPNRLVLTAMPEAAVAAVVDRLHRDDVILPGVVGPCVQADGFAQRWSRLRGASPRRLLALSTYQLDRVVPPRPTAGRLASAQVEDAPLLERWVGAFARDTGVSGGSDPRELVARQIGLGRLFLWRDGGGDPVAMTAWTGPTPHGARVNLVYTPPDLRRRGYASACVAGVSQHLLDSGRRFCFLFTDRANPTSNHIYQEIGYRWVGDGQEWDFVPAPGG